MLTELCITNFALIAHHSVQFLPGMTVLTGETGAGKSIIIDALSLSLGERADSQWIRHGTERCEITARFDLTKAPAAQAWLKAQDFALSDECLLRRTLSLDGKSRAYINGQGVTVQQLRALGECLVAIHGQHEHQALLKRHAQRDLLDQYGKHQALLSTLKEHFNAWQATQARLTALCRAEAQQGRRDFIEFQLAEWIPLAFKATDLEHLEKEHKQLANSGDTLSKIDAALALLTRDEQQNVTHLLQLARQQLSTIKELHPSLDNAFRSIDGASIQLDEAIHDLHHAEDHLEQNPERLTEIDAQLQKIYQLARKHRVKPTELEAFFVNLEEELALLTVGAEQLTELTAELAKERQAYSKVAEQLTKARENTAAELANQISAKMQHLGMHGGRFAIELESLKEAEPSPYGQEQIEFCVSANVGHPLQALAKVASGGELSRISLAIQVILASINTTPTLIFDEVDVGIGGPTAAIVGQLLRELSTSAQILCVTHLAQVAACGTQHYQIAKETQNAETSTVIHALPLKAREQEIARMLSGLSVTEQSLAHARELLGLE